MEAKLTLKVKSLTGETNLDVEILPTEKVLELKRKISENSKATVEQHILFYMGEELEDAKSMSDYGIETGANVLFHLKLPESAPQKYLLYDTSGSMAEAYKQNILKLKTPVYEALKISTYCGCDFSCSVSGSMTRSVVQILSKSEIKSGDEVHIISDFEDSVDSNVDKTLIPILSGKKCKLFLHTVECDPHCALVNITNAVGGGVIKEH